MAVTTAKLVLRARVLDHEFRFELGDLGELVVTKIEEQAPSQYAVAHAPPGHSAIEPNEAQE